MVGCHWSASFMMGARDGVQRWRSLMNKLGDGGDNEDSEWWSSSKIISDQFCRSSG